MSTTIRVSKETSANLEKEVKRRGLKSKDALIRAMLGLEGDANEAAGESPAEEEDDGHAAERKAFQHEKQFFSFADLQKEASAMKYFTGLRVEARLWLWERLKKLVWSPLHFFWSPCYSYMMAIWWLSLSSIDFTDQNLQ